MVTTLEIDKTLLQEALDLNNHPTPTTLIEAALREYIQRRKCRATTASHLPNNSQSRF
jgi:hypothetical protein